MVQHAKHFYAKGYKRLRSIHPCEISRELHITEADRTEEVRARERSIIKQTSELHVKGERNWKTRREKAFLYAGNNIHLRAEVEERERARWVERLITTIEKHKFPRYLRALETKDWHKDLSHCAGKARARTIRQRIRTWEKFTNWYYLAYADDAHRPVTQAHGGVCRGVV